ncbi:MAG: hypothetical protein JSW61_10095 [Candidatus Thorarchaeota archaeon]|nr:MAG: hypothetical protein JSW61_10095 [Candidatus Thorarchaeota archaeon]
MPDEKLSEDEQAKLMESFKDAVLDDTEVQSMAVGEGEEGEIMLPVDSEEDLIAAAASALEFVDALDGPSGATEAVSDQQAVAGFDALLNKLETLRADISSLQRGVVGVFAAQLLTFRGKVVELKSRVSEEMVERLRMKFFKSFIETTFVDIVDHEFSALEKELVDKIVEQTQEKFKEFASRVRESEVDLRTTIVEQQDVVRSFMQSLEQEAAAQLGEVAAREGDVSKLQDQIRALQIEVDQARATGAATEELARKVEEQEAQIESLRADLAKKDGIIELRAKELEAAKAQTQEATMKLGEAQSAIEVYKTEQATAKEAPKASTAEIEAMQKKIDLLETALSEKRDEAERLAATVKDLDTQAAEASKAKDTAEAESASRLAELDQIQDKIAQIKDLEGRVYELERELDESQKSVEIVKMQSEAFEKATRLMEKERDMALERRDVSEERTRRYIEAMKVEARTRTLVIVDEVGSIEFEKLAKTLGIPVGLATKHVRDLEKIGVLKIEGDRAVSTLKDDQIVEGEVKVD